MKIFGIGTDIVKTNRIKKIVEKKEIFLEKLFNKEEILKNAKEKKNQQIVLQKDLLQKKLFQKH